MILYPARVNVVDHLAITFRCEESVVIDGRNEKFLVESLRVTFEDGHLAEVKASGRVVRGYDARPSQLRESVHLLGSLVGTVPVDVSNLPEWAADLPDAVRSHPEYVAYAQRHPGIPQI